MQPKTKKRNVRKKKLQHLSWWEDFCATATVSQTGSETESDSWKTKHYIMISKANHYFFLDLCVSAMFFLFSFTLWSMWRSKKQNPHQKTKHDQIFKSNSTYLLCSFLHFAFCAPQKWLYCYKCHSKWVKRQFSLKQKSLPFPQSRWERIKNCLLAAATKKSTNFYTFYDLCLIA